MKRLLFVLLGATLLARPALAEVERAAFIKLSASVLKVEVLRTQGGYALGSGVVVAAEQVVTNCHVTRDAKEIYVLRGGVRWRVLKQSGDADHDLCLLHAPGLVADPVELGSARSLALGQSVNALGYTGGIGIQNSPGEVLALHRLDGASVIRSSNFFSSGASGGGLFDDELQLVGILTFRLRGGSAHYFAAPMEWLRPLLQDRGRAQAVAPLGAHEVAYWQRPLERQPLFLRAASLERDEKWADLRSLAIEWAHTAPSDPEPWALLGTALEQQGRLGQAQRAFECSLAIEPGYSPARLALAQLQQRQGLPARVAAASPACTPGVL